MKTSIGFIVLSVFCINASWSQDDQGDSSISVNIIWDEGVHNAFGDIIRFKNHFYVSFREGVSHVGSENNGKVRIIKSKDGETWESVALLEIAGLDLRDPKLSVTPENTIMITMAGAVFKGGMAQELFPMVSFSDKAAKAFSTPEKAVLDPTIEPSLDWVWRVTWHKGAGYGIDYQLKENARNRKLLGKDAWRIYLLRTTDGRHYEKVARLEVEDLPNEATVRFDKNDNMYVLVRREAGDQMGVLGKSEPPYNSWEYSPLGFRLGGPNFLFLGDDRLIMGTRIYEAQTATGILLTDLNGKVLNTIKLPSGGDTSYPGMLYFRDALWVVYYSSHEGASKIYLAKIPLGTLKD